MLIAVISVSSVCFLATVYFLIRYILSYRLVNSVAFIELADNPFSAAEAMRNLANFRTSFIVSALITVSVIVAFILFFRYKKNHAPSVCPECGGKILSTETFCSNCGAKKA